MLPGSERAVIELGYREVFPMHVPVGARIDCLGGRIWITEEGGTDDIVLEAGESFDAACAGVAVVQALTKACFALRFRSTTPSNGPARGCATIACDFRC